MGDASASATPEHVERRHGQAFTLRNVQEDLDLGWLGALPFWTPYVLVTVYFLGTVYSSPWLLFWLAFGLIPLLDVTVPLDAVNPTAEHYAKHHRDVKFKLPLWLWVPLQVAVVAWAMRVWTGNDPTGVTIAGAWQSMGFIAATGILSGGLGINIAHELLHKGPVERFLAHILLMTVSYQHFVLEHAQGHHKRVATPEDPASADAGITFYQFYPRTVIGSWQSSYQMSQGGEMALYAVLPWLFAGAVSYAVDGWATLGSALFFFAAQAWFAISLLELINYIEHYGLRRKPLADGSGYEPVDYKHSWNSSHRISNYLLFKLQRHSDHHANARRPYHLLRSFDESPHLPTGYAGMAILALFPRVYFRIMDPLVAAYNAARDKRRDATKKDNEQIWRFSMVAVTAVTSAAFASGAFFFVDAVAAGSE